MDAREFNDLLRKKDLTIVCAESITAGLLASTIASVSGASDVLIGSIVTYNRKLKTAVLHVDPAVIDANSAESMETTVEMTEGLLKIYPEADIFVAVTGVASPSTDRYKVDKEPGQIYVAIFYRGKMYEKQTIIQIQGSDRDELKETDRNIIRKKAVDYIFQVITEIIK
jgi:nicotinamide-nucleotide amidase